MSFSKIGKCSEQTPDDFDMFKDNTHVLPYTGPETQFFVRFLPCLETF